MIYTSREGRERKKEGVGSKIMTCTIIYDFRPTTDDGR